MALFKSKIMKVIPVNSTHEKSSRKKIHVPFSVFGSETYFNGKLILKGETRIAGEIEGTIFSEDLLVIEESATVRGEIHGTFVEIHGTVEGKLEAKELLKLAGTSLVKGEVNAASLIIDEGARLRGSVVSLDGVKKIDDVEPSTVIAAQI